MKISLALYLKNHFPRFHRRSSLQRGQERGRGGGSKARNGLAAVLGRVSPGAADVSLDLQQLGRADRHALVPAAAAAAEELELPRLLDRESLDAAAAGRGRKRRIGAQGVPRSSDELHALDRNGLRHSRLLGEQPRGQATRSVPVSGTFCLSRSFGWFVCKKFFSGTHLLIRL